MTLVDGALGASLGLVTDWPLIVGTVKRAAGSGGSDVRAVFIKASAVQFGEEFVLIPSKTLTKDETLESKRQTKASIIGAKSRNDGGETRFDLFSVLRFEVVVEQDDYGQRKGFGRENSMRCSTLSSRTRNSLRVRSGTRRPSLSFTVTGRKT